jgi:hypothetical protein
MVLRKVEGRMKAVDVPYILHFFPESSLELNTFCAVPAALPRCSFLGRPSTAL